MNQIVQQNLPIREAAGRSPAALSNFGAIQGRRGEAPDGRSAAHPALHIGSRRAVSSRQFKSRPEFAGSLS